MLSNLQRRSGLQLVLIAAVVFFVIVLAFSLHRYHIFYADSDHGIFSQVFWNGVHGRFFQSSISSTYSVSVSQDGDVPEVGYYRLAQHFTPALLLWHPLYALFPSPVTLIVLKVALIAAAGPVLYALSRQYLNPALSAMIVVSFYAANTVIGPALGEFYDSCQLPLFGFGMFLALEKRRWWLFSALAVLILLVREDVGLIVFGTGLYLLISKRYPWIGLALCILSFAYMLLVTSVIMPLFTDEISRRFMMEEFGQYIQGDRASTPEVIWAILTHPGLLLEELFSPLSKTIKYITGHWLPLAFVPAISPAAWIISGFPLLENLLRDPNALSINIRYTTPVVPGLFYGSILWWSTRQELFKSAFIRRFWTLCIALSLFFTVTSNPHRSWSFLIPDSIQPFVYVPLPQQWHHADQARSLLTQIPPDASVSASRYIVAHIPNRRAVLRFPALRLRNDAQAIERVDYVMVDFWYPQQYQTAFKVSREELKDHLATVDRLVKDGKYGVVDFKDGVILMQRGVEPNAAVMADWLTYKQNTQPQIKSK